MEAVEDVPVCLNCFRTIGRRWDDKDATVCDLREAGEKFFDGYGHRGILRVFDGRDSFENSSSRSVTAKVRLMSREFAQISAEPSRVLPSPWLRACYIVRNKIFLQKSNSEKSIPYGKDIPNSRRFTPLSPRLTPYPRLKALK